MGSLHGHHLALLIEAAWPFSKSQSSSELEIIILFIYKRNSKGPRTDPCGTPKIMFCESYLLTWELSNQGHLEMYTSLYLFTWLLEYDYIWHYTKFSRNLNQIPNCSPLLSCSTASVYSMLLWENGRLGMADMRRIYGGHTADI